MMFSVINTLNTILQNVIMHPNEIKYRKLRLSNMQIEANIVNVQHSRFLLEMLGFQECMLESNSGVVFANGQKPLEAYLVLEGDGCELRSIKLLCEIIEKIVKDNDMGSLTKTKFDPTLYKKTSNFKMNTAEQNK